MSASFFMVPHGRVSDPLYAPLGNAAFGLLIRLELVADNNWPVAAGLPRYADPATLRKLEAAGLIELLPNAAFRVTGLDNTRQSRQDVGRLNANKRWVTDRGPMGGHRPPTG